MKIIDDRPPVVATGRYDSGEATPGYLFRSPCCGVTERVPAWTLAAASARNGGVIRLQCGRTATDPLRAAGVQRVGCGQPFHVQFAGAK